MPLPAFQTPAALDTRKTGSSQLWVPQEALLRGPRPTNPPNQRPRLFSADTRVCRALQAKAQLAKKLASALGTVASERSTVASEQEMIEELRRGDASEREMVDALTRQLASLKKEKENATRRHEEAMERAREVCGANSTRITRGSGSG